MFLHYLNEDEGKAFLELSSLAMKIHDEINECEEAELESYKEELNLFDYTIQNKSLEEIITILKNSSIEVKRTIIIELIPILYKDKEIDNEEQLWIENFAKCINMNKVEVEKLIQFGKDFCDFVEVGLMYINLKIE